MCREANEDVRPLQNEQLCYAGSAKQKLIVKTSKSTIVEILFFDLMGQLN
jgi:hypothetical protein